MTARPITPWPTEGSWFGYVGELPPGAVLSAVASAFHDADIILLNGEEVGWCSTVVQLQWTRKPSRPVVVLDLDAWAARKLEARP